LYTLGAYCQLNGSDPWGFLKPQGSHNRHACADRPPLSQDKPPKQASYQTAHNGAGEVHHIVVQPAPATKVLSWLATAMDTGLGLLLAQKAIVDPLHRSPQQAVESRTREAAEDARC